MSCVFIFWSYDFHTASNLFVFFFLLLTAIADRVVGGKNNLSCQRSFSGFWFFFCPVVLLCNSTMFYFSGLIAYVLGPLHCILIF